MAKEISTKEDMLVWRLGQMAEKNAELELRINRLVDEYNCTADELRKLREREREASEKDELSEKREGSDGKLKGAARVTLGEMFQMRDLCDKLEVENTDLKRYAGAMDAFVSRAKLYVERGAACPFCCEEDLLPVKVCSTECLECSSCLRVLPDLGVVCARKLSTWKTGENIRPNLNGKESDND